MTDPIVPNRADNTKGSIEHQIEMAVVRQTLRMTLIGDCPDCLSSGECTMNCSSAVLCTNPIVSKDQAPAPGEALTAESGDGWIAWNGGSNPVGDAAVEVRYRNGETEGRDARRFGWVHWGENALGPAAAWDIIAYRLSRPVATPAPAVVDGVREAVARLKVEARRLRTQKESGPAFHAPWGQDIIDANNALADAIDLVLAALTTHGAGVCPDCKGRGYVAGDPEGKPIEGCDRCNGSGVGVGSVPTGLDASEIGAHIAKRDAEFEARLADLTIPPDVSSEDELCRSICGALMDCPAMSEDKIADFIGRALWPAIKGVGSAGAADDPFEMTETEGQAIVDNAIAGFRSDLAALRPSAAPAAPSDKLKVAREIAERVVLAVCELPDRTSPDDWPEAMLVTGEELHAIVVAALNDGAA